MTCPFGINASEKVVGFSVGIKSNALLAFFGFLYSGGTRYELGKLLLRDISDKDIAVGLVPDPGDNRFGNSGNLPEGFIDGAPFWMDCSNIAAAPQPTAHKIPLSPANTGGMATAVNSKGTVVGTCWAPNYTAFVYDIGQHGLATDLNTHLAAPLPGWTLWNAWDINESGQIVGTAQGSSSIKGFILSPKQ
jgi:hypothetical protein